MVSTLWWPRVQSLVRELRSQKAHSTTRGKKTHKVSRRIFSILFPLGYQSRKVIAWAVGWKRGERGESKVPRESFLYK